MLTLLRRFPVPNSRRDLFEFQVSLSISGCNPFQRYCILWSVWTFSIDWILLGRLNLCFQVLQPVAPLCHFIHIRSADPSSGKFQRRKFWFSICTALPLYSTYADPSSGKSQRGIFLVFSGKYSICRSVAVSLRQRQSQRELIQGFPTTRQISTCVANLPAVQHAHHESDAACTSESSASSSNHAKEARENELSETAESTWTAVNAKHIHRTLRSRLGAMSEDNCNFELCNAKC